ncbi:MULTISPECIES: carbohydrate ABC transporter permease [Cellulomonas]|jgi:alpha-glucoside transport system permease protein|uniref:Alpha-glucoside transport system permease protein n=1 Tax=Cellulomonas iranensis TaxID=76862 RepID=A0ABU0GK03_9CELL|nr:MULTISPECIES: carbohydrate ABC transporter permease [Cellulomonas]MBO9568281.1 carbohydrate ABC transporter permease [Cellulomonas iranensis]MDQ0425681.1 alpha-glucoside transport system permease protein [Cellulomonas iranensis]TFH72043.1 carbohydrate ABC transporter permease [Cellulomonas sp. HD19AZ1]UCN15118.1 carbohydrate ABC transporter permease [Cellulomonas iranensis]
MTTTPPPPQVVAPAGSDAGTVRGDVGATLRATKKRLTSPWATFAAVVLAVIWTIPTFGLLVTSFRPAADINATGWWTVLTNPNFTLENYQTVMAVDSSQSLLPFIINSVVITIPSVVLPIFLATLAAYSFAWMRFPGRDALFVAVFALQVVPIQVTLIPLLTLYADIGVAGTFWAVWISHTMFGLPLAVFLLHNFMREIPGELIEAARVDGAAHVTVFFRLMLPLLKPALAAFGIYQFLWVWNDLLVALTFAGSSNTVAPMTVALFNLTGTRGSQWFLLSAGAFVSIIVPALVFLSLQRYFVRGLLAGSVKG